MIKKLTYVFGLFCFFNIGLVSAGWGQDLAAATGSATWYGARHQGKKTSSGEPFNKNQLTAAHKKLPFGTKVKVTNLANQESVGVVASYF
jgi:rare lipoprotein A